MKIRLLVSALLLKGALACCSLAPADFHGTRGLAAEVEVKGQKVHLMGYQNTAQNKADSANAMFLPIPARKGSMTEKNLLDVSSCPHFLEDIANAQDRGRTLSFQSAEGPNQVQVFDHGLYTVVLAQDAKDIPNALNRVKPERRPQMAPAIFEAYSKWYPGWTFALCCFNSREATQGEPMLWWYEPLNPEQLFFPALDAHSGQPPDLRAKVQVEHDLAVSTDDMEKGIKVRYREEIGPNLAAYLPKRVLSHHLEGSQPNGDFVFDLNSVRDGKYLPKRALPPGAQ